MPLRYVQAISQNVRTFLWVRKDVNLISDTAIEIAAHSVIFVFASAAEGIYIHCERHQRCALIRHNVWNRRHLK
jgi:hypothetical protein